MVRQLKAPNASSVRSSNAAAFLAEPPSCCKSRSQTHRTDAGEVAYEASSICSKPFSAGCPPAAAVVRTCPRVAPPHSDSASASEVLLDGDEAPSSPLLDVAWDKARKRFPWRATIASGSSPVRFNSARSRGSDGGGPTGGGGAILAGGGPGGIAGGAAPPAHAHRGGGGARGDGASKARTLSLLLDGIGVVTDGTDSVAIAAVMATGMPAATAAALPLAVHTRAPSSPCGRLFFSKDGGSPRGGGGDIRSGCGVVGV